MNFADLYGNAKRGKNTDTPDINKLFDRFSVACCCFDAKGALLVCNLAWARLFKLENKSGAKRKFAKLFPKNSREILAENIKAALSDGTANAEIPCLDADGASIFIDISLTRESEKTVSAQAFEITKYRAAPRPEASDAENKLRRLREINRLLLESAPFAIGVWDDKGEFIFCNAQTARLFGLNTPEEYRTRFMETFPEYQPCGTPSAQIRTEMTELTLEQGTVRYENIRRHAITGELIPVETTVVRIVREKGSLVAVFVTDLRPLKAVMARETAALSRWHMVLDTLPVGVNMYTQDGMMLDVNNTMLAQFGCESKDEYFERWQDTFAPTQSDGRVTKEVFAEAVKNTFAQGGDPGREWQMQTIHGEPIPMHINSVVVQEDDMPMLITYAMDLRPMKSAMEKARDEQEFSRMLYESSPYGVSIWSRENEVLSANSRLLSIFETKDLDDYRKTIRTQYDDLQPDGTRSNDSYKLYLDRAFDGETVRFEWQAKTSRGEALPLEITFVPYKRGEEHFVAAYTVDLRNVKAAMEKLRESDERAVALISAMPIPAAFVNSECYVVDCNQAAVKLLAKNNDGLFEYTESEDHEYYYCDGPCEKCQHYRRATCVARRCLIRNWRHTILGYKDDPQFFSEMIRHNCLAAEETGKCVYTNYRRTLRGEELFIEATLVPLKYRGEPGWALYLRDIGETRLREVAEEESRAKTRFLARMSHEIRTPMNAVLGIAEIQLQKGDHRPETEEAFLRIHHSSNLLLSIINDILDLSKVAAGKMEIVPQKYELADMIVETVQLNIMHIGKKKIDFKLKIDENLPRFMEGDEIRIRQIMNNLLSNAFKYTKTGTVVLSISRDVTPSDVTTDLIIEIKDTGQGMTKTQINTLFENEFNRLNLHLNRDIQGSGLGMTITYHLVGLMDGEINVESSPGNGSKFTVRIPQKVIGGEVLGSVAAELQDIEAVKNSLKKIKKVRRENLNYGRVLVVDDVESNLFVAKGMLIPYKLSVETVMSGFEAVELVKNGKVYDVIFMDHMMPGMDGIEATKLIRDEGYTKPIVALTANILVGQEEMFLSNGFNDFVSKPIDANKFDECLKKFITPPENITPPISSGAPENLSDALVSSFLRDAGKVTKTLEEIFLSQNFDEKNTKLFTINTHAMKSALANIGETALSDTAGALEDASRAGDFEKIQAETETFLKNLAAVVEKLTPQTAPDTADEDPQLLRAQMKILREACDAYDKKSAKKALAALDGKAWSAATKETLDKISAALLHSDFEEAAKIAGK